MKLFFTTLALGMIIGYWLYPLNMTFKLMKINKKLVALEIEHMKIMEDLNGKQWNEDKL
jgi:hypothetical protein